MVLEPRDCQKVPCSYCGKKWDRSELRKDAQGDLICALCIYKENVVKRSAEERLQAKLDWLKYLRVAYPGYAEGDVTTYDIVRALSAPSLT